MTAWRQFLVAVTGLMAASLMRGEERATAWPDGTPTQLREDVFGVRFRLIRELDGPKAGLELLRREYQRAPRPQVKAYYAWIGLFPEVWGYPEMKDATLGLRLAGEAIREGSVLAGDILARAKRRGLGGPGDPVEIVKLLREAVRRGGPGAKARLAGCYASGYAVAVDWTEADRLAREAAGEGEPGGLTDLGWACEIGGVEMKPDMARALAYYFEAAGYADPDARQRLIELEKKSVPGAKLHRAILAVCDAFRFDLGMPTRVRASVRELSELAGEHPAALVELARVHLSGTHITIDHAYARDCLNRAAAQGSLEARFLLAQMRLQGWGEKAAPSEALAAIRDLADQGCVEATAYLGYLHYWGAGRAPGAEKNPEKAFAYVRKAAGQGNLEALLNLGSCYEQGIGTPVSYALAVKVYWQAYVRGAVDARNRVRRLLPFVIDI